VKRTILTTLVLASGLVLAACGRNRAFVEEGIL